MADLVAGSDIASTSTMVAIYPSQEFLALASKHAHQDLIDEGLHVTLFYVGDTDPSEDASLLEALSQALSGFKVPVPMNSAGPGCFYNPQEKTLVRKLTMNGIGLEFLRTKVIQSMWKAGFVGPQSHGFSAHLTLEYHDTSVLEPGWERCGMEDYPDFDVDRIYLVRSNDVVGSVKLGGEVTLGGVNPAIEYFK